MLRALRRDTIGTSSLCLGCCDSLCITALMLLNVVGEVQRELNLGDAVVSLMRSHPVWLLLPHLLCSLFLFSDNPYLRALSHLSEADSRPCSFNYYINLTVSAVCACCDCCEWPANKWRLYPPSHPLYFPTLSNAHKHTHASKLALHASWGPSVLAV